VAPLYSERFLQVAGTTVPKSYTVPAGHRIVLRCIELVQASQIDTQLIVTLGGIYIWNVLLPGGVGYAHFDTRQVAYAGELLQMQSVGGTGHAVASGYLFEDTSPRAQQLPEAPQVPDNPPPEDMPGVGPQPR
jgi:hypothetical protein